MSTPKGPMRVPIRGDDGSDVQIVPPGYTPLPDGTICKCPKMWRSERGEHWCCNAGTASPDALQARVTRLTDENADLRKSLDATRAELAAERAVHDNLRRILNTPMLQPFAEAVVHEAHHQLVIGRDDQDARKTPWDWFWTLGYLSQKAAAAAESGDVAKALHHTISSGALLANWHRQLAFKRAGEACK